LPVKFWVIAKGCGMEGVMECRGIGCWPEVELGLPNGLRAPRGRRGFRPCLEGGDWGGFFFFKYSFRTPEVRDSSLGDLLTRDQNTIRILFGVPI